jgi:hypothetical protein
MGIEQIRMNQTKALPPVPHFNWSQMESSYAKSNDSLFAREKINWMVRIDVRSKKEIQTQAPGTKRRNLGHPASNFNYYSATLPDERKVRLKSQYPAQSQATKMVHIPPNATKSCQRLGNSLSPLSLGIA